MFFEARINFNKDNVANYSVFVEADDVNNVNAAVAKSGKLRNITDLAYIDYIAEIDEDDYKNYRDANFITFGALKSAYEQKIVKIAPDENYGTDELVVYIGENSFFFNDATSGKSLKAYRASVSDDEILEQVMSALDGIYDIDKDEYFYYSSVVTNAVR